MPHQIAISGITGTSPYDVYVCDITNTFCYLISGATSMPPAINFIVPPPLNNVNSLLVKIIDYGGCELFHYYEC